MATGRKSSPTAALIEHLRQLGLRKYPGAHLKSPWPGHLDLAVNDKTLAYLSAPDPDDDDAGGVSLKLPLSCSIALSLPGSEPTAYGLGKSGWVSLSFEHGAPPVAQVESWLDESYRAQAPKKLLAQLDGAPATTKTAPRARKAKAAGKRAPGSGRR
ncbi:MAG: MmcQ/YjbR family DNA-binding protein [Planctomycetota bacterium]